MRQTTVDITTGDGIADAYLVKPDGNEDYPAVLFFMDGFGLRPRLFEMADRIAERGFVVLVPNLFYRAGRAQPSSLGDLRDPKQRAKAIERIISQADGLTSEDMARDAGVYLDFLAGQVGVRPGPVAVVGYCMGGTNAVRQAQAHPDRIAAVASFHGGRFVSDKPDSPHLHVASITGRLYLAHADQDRSMTADQIKALESALDEAGVTYTSEVYPGAPHGFTMTDTSSYHELGEQRHWTKLFELLDRTF
jgi:carboxymethylenebutenolidase